MYLITSWSRVLLEMLTGSQLLKKFHPFYGTRRFITALTSARSCLYPEPARSCPCPHISLPEDPNQCYPPIYAWVLQVVSFTQVSPPKPCIRLCFPPIDATCLAHIVLVDLFTWTMLGEEYRSLSSSLCSFLHSPVTSSFLVPYILLSPLFLRFKLLDSKLEDKAFCTEWYQAFPYSTLLLISSWIEFWFVKFVSIYLKRQRHSMFFLFFFFFVFPWHFAICSDDRAQTLFYVNL